MISSMRHLNIGPEAIVNSKPLASFLSSRLNSRSVYVVSSLEEELWREVPLSAKHERSNCG